MADYPSLNYIPLEMLLAVGDPWRVDETLQSGDPSQIAELASAFQQAGGCTQETWAEWEQARARFNESWNRENGVHPIDDSAELHRATTQLFVQKDQLPLIAVDLQNIAADLASAESQSASKTADLNAKLQILDTWVGEAIADDRDYSKHLDEAESMTSAALAEVERIQDDYTDKLERAAFDLRLKHGYDPAGIEDVDGDADVSPEERGRTAPEYYNSNHRAKDEALINRPGPWTPEKADAAARLQDYETASAPADAPKIAQEHRELAAQRLDDFRMANYVGPLPRDPILGGDARTRAQGRLELQRQLEQGALGYAPLDRDSTTLAMNNGESFARVTVTREAYFAMTTLGLSGDGAMKFLADVASGAAPIVGGAGTTLTGLQGYGANLSQPGRQPMPGDLFSAGDAKVLEKAAGRLGTAGDLLQIGVAVNEFLSDTANERRHEEFGGALGNVVGGAGGTAFAVATAGAFTNPVTAAIAAGVFVYLASEVGESVGGNIGGTFDTSNTATGG
ncbi:hypothetical protein BH10ACT9_BH10ACT9_38180 [soil metagenome]